MKQFTFIYYIFVCLTILYSLYLLIFSSSIFVIAIISCLANYIFSMYQEVKY